MSSAPPPPPSLNPEAPPRIVRAPPRRPPPRAPGPPPWAERRPAVSVDLDRGRRSVRTEVDGVRAASLPARHRLRVEGNRWQRDWKVSEVVARLLALPRADADAVDAVLNCWAGRFARRNFPLLIRVSPILSLMVLMLLLASSVAFKWSNGSRGAVRAELIVQHLFHLVMLSSNWY